MPTAYVKQLADKHGVPISTAEERWALAKKQAKKQGHAEEYDYVTGIFKKMMGEGVEQLDEVKAGEFKSPRVGRRVKVVGEKHKGKEGVVVRASREHTFSQMVPFIVVYTVKFDDGTRGYDLRDRDLKFEKKPKEEPVTEGKMKELSMDVDDFISQIMSSEVGSKLKVAIQDNDQNEVRRIMSTYANRLESKIPNLPMVITAAVESLFKDKPMKESTAAEKYYGVENEEETATNKLLPDKYYVISYLGSDRIAVIAGPLESEQSASEHFHKVTKGMSLAAMAKYDFGRGSHFAEMSTVNEKAEPKEGTLTFKRYMSQITPKGLYEGEEDSDANKTADAKKTRKAIRDAISEIADSASFKKDGTIVVKREYYYRPKGLTPAQYGAGIKSRLEKMGFKVEVVDTLDHWAPYPRDSFYAAVIKVTQGEAK